MITESSLGLQNMPNCGFSFRRIPAETHLASWSPRLRERQHRSGPSPRWPSPPSVELYEASYHSLFSSFLLPVRVSPVQRALALEPGPNVSILFNCTDTCLSSVTRWQPVVGGSVKIPPLLRPPRHLALVRHRGRQGDAVTHSIVVQPCRWRHVRKSARTCCSRSGVDIVNPIVCRSRG